MTNGNGLNNCITHNTYGMKTFDDSDNRVAVKRRV